MTMSLVKNFSRNLLYQILGMGIGILVTFFITPYIIKRVDPSLYGLYALMFSIVNYFNIMNFGINAATIKYVAEYNAAKKWQELNDILNMSFTLFFTIGSIVGVSIFYFSFYYQHFFKVPAEFILYGRYFMWIFGIEMVLTFFLMPVTSALQGIQRADIIKKINIIATFFKVPLAVFFFNSVPPAQAFLLFLITDGLLINILFLYCGKEKEDGKNGSEEPKHP